MTGVAVLRARALDLYRAALAGADPGPPLLAVLAELEASEAPLWIVAIGKAARRMAGAATAAAARSKRRVAGGIVVGAEATGPAPGLLSLTGDHPIPGGRSFEASRALTGITEAVAPGDDVWVLLSGGASSLVGAPAQGLTREDVEAAWRMLYAAGLPIGELNLVRKRLSCWGAGRLATALEQATVRTFALSDVPGDDPSAIGSGPCDPDPSKASDVRRLLALHRLFTALPPGVRDALQAEERGERPETPKPDRPVFRTSRARIIAGNAGALEGAASLARGMGLPVRTSDRPLAGEAGACGVRLAEELLTGASPGPLCRLWGGEPVVRLGDGGSQGLGGRAQELALAAAGLLERRPSSGLVVLLAGSTDGRDGPTEAAGAIVDAETWGRIRARGIDPLAALARHDAYPALDAAGDLIRTGPTGTNVMDVVIGLVE
ncbi:MAG: glycerate kinase type-2 family protein [Gemmatimonadales bacterium]